MDYFPLMDWALVQDPRDSLGLIVAQHLGQRASVVEFPENRVKRAASYGQQIGGGEREGGGGQEDGRQVEGRTIPDAQTE